VTTTRVIPVLLSGVHVGPVIAAWRPPEEAAAYSNAMERHLGVASGAGTKLPMPRGGIVPAFPDEST